MVDTAINQEYTCICSIRNATFLVLHASVEYKRELLKDF